MDPHRAANTNMKRRTNGNMFSMADDDDDGGMSPRSIVLLTESPCTDNNCIVLPAESPRTDNSRIVRPADTPCTDYSGTVTPTESPCTDFSQSPSPIQAVYTGANCDVCGTEKHIGGCMYCPECMQKLCHLCTVIHNRLGETRKHCSILTTCWPEGESLGTVTLPIDEDHGSNSITSVAATIRDNLGIQVCINYDEEDIEIRAPTKSILNIAKSTVHTMKEPSKEDNTYMVVRIKDGDVEWVIRGNLALTTVKLFQENLKQMEEMCPVDIIKGNSRKDRKVSRDTNGTSPIEDNTNVFERTDTGNRELVIRTNFNDFEKVNTDIEDLLNTAKTVPKAEILRPKQDEFRMRIYTMMKEVKDDVVCFVESLENVLKLVIKALDEQIVENVKQEFLSLFCKDCSSCHEESPRPTYLACKHVLCLACVKVSTSHNDGLKCPVCNDQLREKTPLLSLQLKCIQALDQMTGTPMPPVLSTQLSKPARKISQMLFFIIEASLYIKTIIATVYLIRKFSVFIGELYNINHVTKPQMSMKIPRYLLNRWKKSSGGIQRLKTLIESKYGLQVTGTDDNLKIYGQLTEVLELAIQTIEMLNTNTTQVLETGITSRIADKKVEWRFHGDFARISRFLFNKELNDLNRKFRTVSIQGFTETFPNIVDVTCNYSEYIKVKYEIEELVNDLKGLFTDECIQPRNFFFNEKVKEFVQVKHRDTKVHCTHVVKNNLNVVIIRGRRKEFVQSAKEQLLRWS